VPEVKHFDNVFVLLNSVVNNNGGMLQLSDTRPFSNCATHAGELAKQIQMVEQSTPKTTCGVAIVFGNVADDFSEVA
jgi:hypothetical protein